MVKIAVAGAAGRMGSRICALSGEQGVLKIVCAFEKKGHPAVGRDAGDVAGAGSMGVRIEESIAGALREADVIIDFTYPDSTLANLKAASESGKAMVIGTTGFTKEALEEVRNLAEKVPVVQSYNMSLGVNLLARLLQDAARALGDDYDVEVIEAHHKMKKDAPSGTAIMLARAVADASGRDFDECAVYARKGMIGERKKKEIGIQTIRAGDIVGEHTVMFGGIGERIEFTHRVSSRDTFARGALRAALWIAGKPAGIYNMQDVLGLK